MSFLAKKDSSGDNTSTPSPVFPARPVRPSRWMYCSRLEGTPICTTSVTSSKSTPRAVTSLVIIIADRAARKRSVAFVRALWLSLEWISITSSRMFPKSLAASDVPRAVVKNTMILCLPGFAAQCSSTTRLSCANCSSSGAIRRA